VRLTRCAAGAEALRRTSTQLGGGSIQEPQRDSSQTDQVQGTRLGDAPRSLSRRAACHRLTLTNAGQHLGARDRSRRRSSIVGLHDAQVLGCASTLLEPDSCSKPLASILALNEPRIRPCVAQDNNIGDQGAQAFAAALANSQLESLYIEVSEPTRTR